MGPVARELKRTSSRLLTGLTARIASLGLLVLGFFVALFQLAAASQGLGSAQIIYCGRCTVSFQLS